METLFYASDPNSILTYGFEGNLNSSHFGRIVKIAYRVFRVLFERNDIRLTHLQGIQIAMRRLSRRNLKITHLVRNRCPAQLKDAGDLLLRKMLVYI